MKEYVIERVVSLGEILYSRSDALDEWKNKMSENIRSELNLSGLMITKDMVSFSVEDEFREEEFKPRRLIGKRITASVFVGE